MGSIENLIANSFQQTRKKIREMLTKSAKSAVKTIGHIFVHIAGFFLVYLEHVREIYNVYMHRLIVAIRETSGHPPFGSLLRPPRSVCLSLGKRCQDRDIQLAVKTILNAGCERITVCHEGPPLQLSSQHVFEEVICSDMGKSQVVNMVSSGFSTDANQWTNTDVVLLLSSDTRATGFSPSSVKLERCVNASCLYYSELIPLYSLHPSDIYLALSMFQSKLQRFGR